jgi:hypothetical protein
VWIDGRRFCVSIKVTAVKHSTRLWHNKIPEFYL